jgi:hypothetical protein
MAIGFGKKYTLYFKEHEGLRKQFPKNHCTSTILHYKGANAVRFIKYPLSGILLYLFYGILDKYEIVKLSKLKWNSLF